MARRRRRRKKSALDYIALPKLDLDPDTKKGIFIVFLLVLGVISILGLFDKAGMVGEYLKQGLIIAFGWGGWVFPLMLLAWGYMLYDDERFELRTKNYIGAVMFLLSFHALLFLFIEYSQWQSALASGAGGGYVGLFLADAFIKLMGFVASLLVTLSLFLISILLTFDTSLARIFGRESMLAKFLLPLNFILAKIFNKKDDEDDDEEDEDEEDEDDDEEDEDEEDEDDNEEDEDEEDEEDEDEDEDEEKKKEEDHEKIKEPEFMAKPIKDMETEELWWSKPTGVKINLPFSLLNGKKDKPTSGDIKENKEIIRRTLENFGIPVEMGGVSVGPTVTQYTFKPAEGIKLSRITNLSNDLALALASHPIRIEAPIPGKSLVGVEVPNQVKAIVNLKEILSSKNYKDRKNDLMIALGKDVAGKTWLDDITKMPHLLVAGATNSGKSVCLNSIIVSLMYQNNPDDLRFIVVDPKRVEMTEYNRIPYLLTPVITDVNKTINALKWCLNEMDRRYDILHIARTKNIQNYNEKAEAKMPYIIFIIDELADLMVAAAKEVEGPVIRLAQMARAVGIHLILATQRPSVDVITGLIKANMPARIAFSVASGTDSRTILDSLGAEKLLGRGDMLFQNAEIPKPVRLQGSFLSEEEIKKIVKYIINKGGSADFCENITERQKVQGIGGVGLDGTKGDEDELLYEARETVVNMGRASASLLQRKLRIGYARAASILDQLEEFGIIGPANGSKPREILISKEQHEAIGQTGVSGVNLHKRDETEAPENYLGEENDSPIVFRDEEEDNDEDDDEIGEDENEDEYEEDEDEDEEDEEEDKDEEDEDEDE
ncbi:MAG: DNA translocase FtsK 4TM domain-containing protein, partial [Patescibacteria group bacterium]|nr:DNA translocase FtsK 4TM domain-containing protein [Patescibacteria group bacterium]